MLDALRVGRKSFPVHGILELDVTEAVAELRRGEHNLSFTAFVVAATARAVAQHPLVHAYRDHRGRLVIHDRVDVATLIEVEDAQGTFPLGHLLRDAGGRTVDELSAELRSVAADIDESESGRMLRGPAARIAAVPGLMRLAYRLMAHSPRLRGRTGTVAVTAVGMFGSGGGIGIGQPTIMTLSVLIGGRSWRPRVVDGEIQSRLVLDLTVSVDHAVVDGAPAARFAATLTELIENPTWVTGA